MRGSNRRTGFRVAGPVAATLAVCMGLICSGCGPRSDGAAEANMISVASTVPSDPVYILNPGDELQITVWKEEGLDQKVLVRPDGMISFPLAGHIKAAGLTTQRVEAILKQRLARVIENPTVNVSVIGTPGYKIYVIGQVQRPGTFSSPQRLTVIQALTLAGGLTPFGDEDSIIIIRNVQGKQRFIRFNFSRAKRGIDLEQNITLESGDVVVVRD